MRTTRRWLVVVTLFLLLHAAHAFGAQLTIEPSQPTPADYIRIRIDIEGDCDPTSGVADVNLAGHVVTVNVSSGDVCNINDPNHTTTPRFIPVGVLPAGVYKVRFVSCGFGPAGEVCTEFRHEALAVAGVAEDIQIVPAASLWSSAILAFVLLLTATRARG